MGYGFLICLVYLSLAATHLFMVEFYERPTVAVLYVLLAMIYFQEQKTSRQRFARLS